MELHKKNTLLWVLFLVALVGLTVTLGALQYRWIGEVSVAERARLQGSLESSLRRLSLDLNNELTTGVQAIMPPSPDESARQVERYAERFLHFRESAQYGRLFRRIVIAQEDADGKWSLHTVDRDKNTISPTGWPSGWERLHTRISPSRDQSNSDPGEPRRPRFFGPTYDATHQLIAIPLMVWDSEPAEPGFGRPPPEPFHWMIAELDMDFVRSDVLPGLVNRHLGVKDSPHYQLQLTPRDAPDQILFSTKSTPMGDTADASINTLEVYWDQLFRRWEPQGGFGRGRVFVERSFSPQRGGPLPPREKGWSKGPGPGGRPQRGGPPFGAERGNWKLSVRHSAGSLEAAVEQTRRRNLAVTGALVLLILAAAGALVVLARRAHWLAQLQMNFVAGVSHELRTPLTVINMAAHNLSSGLVKPDQMKRYGTLIKEKSERLNEMIEQTLRFASAKAGRVVGERKLVALEPVIEDALEASSHAVDQSHCTVETTIADGLPAIHADSKALSHALQNLIRNAAKHGSGGDWIGVAAKVVPNGRTPTVEIQVVDHGAGIPQNELKYIFDPFYRGKRAMEDQVEGTGLGLSLVKKIIEAHQGTISVESQVNRGTRFVIHLPGSWEQTDEPADPFS
jgi:signal transduction histidine kinase